VVFIDFMEKDPFCFGMVDHFVLGFLRLLESHLPNPACNLPSHEFSDWKNGWGLA
jgi:hypothetical protein